MTLIVTSEFELNRVVAPRLPTAPAEYEARYQDQFADVLRLYFNRLDNILGQLETKTTTATLQVPYGSFYQDGVTTLSANITNTSTTPIQVASTTAFAPSGALLIEQELISYTGKTATTFTGITRGVYGTTNVAHTAGVFVSEALGVPSATVEQALIFTGTAATYGIELSALNTSRVVCTTAGVYNFAFSMQLLNYTTTDDNVTVWFKKNGTDIEFSAGVAQVNSKHGSNPGASIVAWNIIVNMNVADYIEIYFSSETGNTVCATYPAGTTPTTPISPSVILTATFVSALPP
jgi:hypothetical protein